MGPIEKRCDKGGRRRLLCPCLVAAIILASWGLGAVVSTRETAAQPPGVWGGPGVAPPSAPAPPYSYPRPYDPRAFYPPPYYPYPPNAFYPCPRVWVPGYYDGYGNWVFGYYQYQCY